MAELLTWPSGILPASFDWYLNSNGAAFTSPWNGQTQTVSFPGSSWIAKVELSRLDDYESREIEALIVQLDGMAGRIRLWDMGRFPRTVTSSPKISVAGLNGSILLTNGWFAGDSLRRGDYITLNDELKMVLSDSVANNVGEMTIQIGPRLRMSPPVNTLLHVNRPYGIFRLEGGKNGVKRSPAFSNDITLNFVEAF